MIPVVDTTVPVPTGTVQYLAGGAVSVAVGGERRADPLAGGSLRAGGPLSKAWLLPRDFPSLNRYGFWIYWYRSLTRMRVTRMPDAVGILAATNNPSEGRLTAHIKGNDVNNAPL